MITEANLSNKATCNPSATVNPRKVEDNVMINSVTPNPAGVILIRVDIVENIDTIKITNIGIDKSNDL